MLPSILREEKWLRPFQVDGLSTRLKIPVNELFSVG